MFREGGIMKRIFFVGLSVVFCFSNFVASGLQNARAGDAGSGTYKLTKQWETKQELRVPESVQYDEERNILYVSSCVRTFDIRHR